MEKVVEHPDFMRINSLVEQDLKKDIEGNHGAYVDDWHGNVRLPEYLRRTPLYPRYFRPCRMLFSGLTVHSSGLVDACRCHNFNRMGDLIVGDIKESGLYEMWNGARLESLRRNWKRKNMIPDACQTCRAYLY
jgi:radical SAM protein with 4Fe4S-binding SPASM domain